MKVGLIGLGYWGKILLKNLSLIGVNDITICDTAQTIKNSLINQNLGRKYRIVTNIKNIDSDVVIISTPVNTHYSLCNFFLSRGQKVFCEKPLARTEHHCEKLYEEAEKNSTNLFVDWVFTFNKEVNAINTLYKNDVLGAPVNINMNRLNFGPERTDVSARFDLASHDISILSYLFNDDPVKIKWADYKRWMGSKMHDSCFGILEYENFNAQINVSWRHGLKDRTCSFDFEKDHIQWDDTQKKLELSNHTVYNNLSTNMGIVLSYDSPVMNSLDNFLFNEKFDFEKQRELTLRVAKILEGSA
jgi:predicted dehydrogenase